MDLMDLEAVILDTASTPIKNDRYAHAELFPKGFMMKSILAELRQVFGQLIRLIDNNSD